VRVIAGVRMRELPIKSLQNQIPFTLAITLTQPSPGVPGEGEEAGSIAFVIAMR
jgi:hypothetical protein